jgi:shikimate dehydrogenase
VTTARTALVCLLGNPVGHSMSPQLHTAAFTACGIDAVYVACAVTDVRAAVAGLDALGALGANITVPHKRAVWQLVPRRTEEARHIGAANTLFRDGGTWVADNTDAVGLQRVLTTDIGLGVGDAAVVFGAGGAARAAAVALGRLGARVRIEARRDDRAADVQRLAVEAGATPLGGAARPRLVINATPLGLHGELLPERYRALAADQLALDLTYGPEPTPFVRAARAAGAQAWDGLGMLVAQAGASFERWTGVPAPIERMWEAARSQLRQR